MRKIYEKIRDVFKRNSSIFIISLLIVLFIIIYMFNNIVYTINSGQGGVLYLRFFGGTVVDRVYPEGIHFIFPWDKMYIYNTRIQEYFHEFDVLSKKGLKIHLLISIRYYPEYNLLGILHQKVGPDYLNKVVIPEIESVLRIIIGKIDAEEVYSTKTSLIQEAINTAIEQVSQRFVKVDDVIIKTITLPTSIEKAIQYKVEQQHLAEAYIFKIEKEKREAERKRIEAQGLRDYNKTVKSSLSEQILLWKGIEATLELSRSKNAKVVVIGGGKNGLPIVGTVPMEAGDKNDISEIKSPDSDTSEEMKSADSDKSEIKSPDSDVSEEMKSSDSDKSEEKSPLINTSEKKSADTSEKKSPDSNASEKTESPASGSPEKPEAAENTTLPDKTEKGGSSGAAGSPDKSGTEKK